MSTALLAAVVARVWIVRAAFDLHQQAPCHELGQSTGGCLCRPAQRLGKFRGGPSPAVGERVQEAAIVHVERLLGLARLVCADPVDFPDPDAGHSEGWL